MNFYEMSVLDNIFADKRAFFIFLFFSSGA